MALTKKYLEEENKWLWYYHTEIQDNTEFVEVKQYNKKGIVIASSNSLLPPKKYRPKHPKET
jgi:hypothetical protein